MARPKSCQQCGRQNWAGSKHVLRKQADGTHLCTVCQPDAPLRQKHPKNPFAAALRIASTKSEERMLRALRSLEPQGIRFRPQVPLHGYVADFYCASQRLVVELDGKYHHTPERAFKDAVRDERLKSHGIRTLRFPSAMAINDTGFVLRQVRTAVGL
jgi:very-short-patch-repair endonuclease